MKPNMNQRHVPRCGVSVALLALVSFTMVSPATAEPPDWSPQRYENGLREDDQAVLESKRVTWPQPVRQAAAIRQSTPVRQSHSVLQAQYTDETVSTQPIPIPVPEPDELELNSAGIHHAGMADVFAEGDADHTPALTHQVINSPTRGQTSKHGGKQRPPSHPLHPNYRLHHQVQAPPATLPEAKQRETWKTPYSYGYFGASSTRSWSMHTGYRDRYTEWRLR